jgi:glycosyltransferase involved in cell wall biosynthesis
MTAPVDRDLSVIIPTRNRVESLARCLDALKNQNLAPARFEVVIVDNDSDDGSYDKANQRAGAMPFRTTVLVEKQRGPAAARNKGIDHARGRRLLFIGDDILASPSLLAEHLAAAREHSECAILGYTDWVPHLGLTPFMRYLAPARGPQFRYATIVDPLNCGYGFFYTSNISLGREWLERERFDPAFPYAALEDAELGYRLERRGLRIVFHRPALAYHDHRIRFRDFLGRIRQMGESTVILYYKYPELRSNYDMIPSEGHRRVMGKWRRRLAAWLLARLIQGLDAAGFWCPPEAYRYVLEHSFVRAFTVALDRAERQRSGPPPPEESPHGG